LETNCIRQPARHLVLIISNICKATTVEPFLELNTRLALDRLEFSCIR